MTELKINFLSCFNQLHIDEDVISASANKCKSPTDTASSCI